LRRTRAVASKAGGLYAETPQKKAEKLLSLLVRPMDARLRHRQVSGALAGASFIVVTQVATRDKVSCALYVATALFSFALPFLLLFWLSSPFKTAELSARGDIEGMESFVLIVLLDVAGFAALFFHFGLLPGSLFLLAVVIATCVLLLKVEFSLTLFWDLIRRYPSLPTRLFKLALDAIRKGERPHNQT